MTGLQTLLLWLCISGGIAFIAGFDAVLAWTNANSGMASWAQAIFSVLAILAAGWIATFQTQRAERVESERRRVERLGRLYAVKGVLTYARACFLMGQRHAQDGADPHNWEQLKVEIDQCRSVIKNLPVLDLPGPTLAIRFAILDQSLRAVHDVADRNVDSQHEMVKALVRNWFKGVCKQGDDAVSWCEIEIAKISTPEEIAQASAMHQKVVEVPPL